MEMANGLRQIGFSRVKPVPGGLEANTFLGGLGPMKVDVSYADDQSGLTLAAFVTTICFPPHSENLLTTSRVTERASALTFLR